MSYKHQNSHDTKLWKFPEWKLQALGDNDDEGGGVLVARVIPANLWQEVGRGRQRGDEKSHRLQVHVFTVLQYFESLGG